MENRSLKRSNTEALSIIPINLKPIFIQEYLDIDLHDYMVESGGLCFENINSLVKQIAEAPCILEERFICYV